MNRSRNLIIALLAFVAIAEIAQGAVAKKGGCRPGWTKHGDYCYSLNQGKKLGHVQASEACKAESSQAQLADVVRHDAAGFLAKQAQRDIDDSFWVSGEGKGCPTFKNGTFLNSNDCLEEKSYICAELDKFAGCPDGFIGFGNFCYSQQDIRRTWTLARLACMAVTYRGNLATVNSREEYDFIKREFGSGENKHLWIGLHKETADTPYRWSDKQRVQYLPWAASYKGDETRGYVTMSLSDTQFESQNSSELLVPFLCSTVRVVDAAFSIRDTIDEVKDVVQEEIQSINQAIFDAGNEVIDANEKVANEIIDAAVDVKDEVKDASSRVVQLLSDCPRDWFPFGDNCYQAFFERTTFAGARFKCKQMGADLPSFRNPFESIFVQTHVVNGRPSESYWIGLSNTSLGLYWTDGSPVDYVNRASGDSDNSIFPPFKNCFTIDGMRFEWTPRTCELPLFYVCEKPNERVTTTTAATTAAQTTVTTPATAVNTTMATFRRKNAQEPEPNALLMSQGRDPKNQESSSTESGSSSNTAAIFGVLAGSAALVVVAFGVVRWRRQSGKAQYTWTPLPSGRKSSKHSALELESAKQTLKGEAAESKGHQYGTMA